MAVITISRQFGSGGDEIAEQVCQILGYRYFDRHQIMRAAREAGISMEDMESYTSYTEENYKLKKFVDHLLRRTKTGPLGMPSRLLQPEYNMFNESSALGLVQRAICAAYHAGNYVIVGRGGQVILRERPEVLHVRIECPLEERIKRVQQHLREEQQAYYPKSELRRSAQDLIRERDTASADYVRHFYDADWADPLHYHVVFNTGKLSADDAIQTIVQMVHCLFP